MGFESFPGLDWDEEEASPGFGWDEEEWHEDSTGNVIATGDRVRFRGLEYTIKAFKDGAGSLGCATIEFEEFQDTEEVAEEFSVDKID